MQVASEVAVHRPASVAEALALAQEFAPRAVFLAGGTEVLITLKRRQLAGGHLISLARIPDLAGIRASASGISIGAMTRLADVADSAIVGESVPALAAAVRMMAGEQVRQQATIGGNFCGAVPCADTPPVCIAARATVRILGADGTRNLPAEQFFKGPRQTALDKGEMLLAIDIPHPSPNTGASYQRFARRAGNALAVASVAARVVLDGPTIADARVVMGAVAPVPLLSESAAKQIVGRTFAEADFANAIAEAANRAATEAQPITDVRGTIKFRRELVRVLTRRALLEAIANAQTTPR